MTRYAIPALALVTVLFALYAYLFVGPKPEVTGEFYGTIIGSVLLGPTCPVVRDPPDEECADKPYSTRLALTSADGSKVFKEFTSDNSGAFRLDVQPGTYAIRSAAAANVLPYCSANEFTVPVNDSIEIAVSCDTGIR